MISEKINLEHVCSLFVTADQVNVCLNICWKVLHVTVYVLSHTICTVICCIIICFIFSTHDVVLLNYIYFLFQILMILFAVLRKRAWNYGRIALVQKTEEK